MGHMGNPAAVTPFLDEFAAGEAVSFRQAFCQNPVCVPSRCSFFTGLYPHVQGHRTMSYLLHPGEKDLFSELRENGYYVWMNARNDLYAGQETGWAESHGDRIFFGGNVPPAPEPEESDGMPYSHYGGKLPLDEQGRNYGSDDEAVDEAVRFVKARSWGEQPLCLFLGLMLPHVPYQVEEPYFSRIDRKKLLPRVKAEECSGKSLMSGAIRKYQNMGGYTEGQWDELRAVYLGMCAKVDQLFERLCCGLKEAGIYDDCVIFFLSDHGDFAGDYGLTEKAQNSFEDCLTRVPLMIKPPVGEPADPGVTDALAELVDFYGTAVDYAGITPGRTHFGRSLRTVVEDRSRSVRDYVTCEGGRLPEEKHCDEYHSAGPAGPSSRFVYWPKMKAQSEDDAHAKGAMLRNKRYKYISRVTGEDEFYDLLTDPQEKHNRIHDPKCQSEIARMQVEQLRWYQRTCDVVPYEYDRRFTDEMVWAKVKGICPPGHEEEVKEKIRSGMKQGLLYLYLMELRGKL